MEKIVITGGQTLKGTVRINGAKNSAVALLPAAILADSVVTIEGLPNISDVDNLIAILEELGAKINRQGQHAIQIDPTNVKVRPLPNGKVSKLRASYYFMGAMLGKFHQATIGLPGGCHLGHRPIDQHMKGFEALGAKVVNDVGTIKLKADELHGERIYLDVVSVGATINIMLAAVLSKGRTTIENAAKEPEIIDVATLLTNMGAVIKGVGTDIIRIDGVDKLHGCTHTIIPDRIEAGTYVIAAAAQGKEVIVDNVIPEHLESLIAKLREMGVHIEQSDEQLLVKPNSELKPVNIKTLVYPGFPTDLQQPFTTLLTKANGESIVIDTIYRGRLKHIDELIKMNANVKVANGSIVIKGNTPLKGTRVNASELRAGASLVIAGLMGQGVTEIHGIEYIERGYENITEKLQKLGAIIKKVPLSVSEYVR